MATLHTPLTQGRLQHAAVLLAVTHGMNLIVAVHQSPEVVLVVRAVQAQPEARPQGAHHRGDAGRGQVPGVKRLQLHANLELILGRDLVLGRYTNMSLKETKLQYILKFT